MILDDPESISAMNVKYIPVKFKTNGEVDKRYEDKLYSYSEWENISDTIEKSVLSVADKMKRGEIPATSIIDGAKETPCEYCKFKAFCRNMKI